MTRKEYQETIDADMEWLKRQPDTIWRNHIMLVLETSPAVVFDKLDLLVRKGE